MTEYNYHVFVRPKGDDTYRLIARDLSERDLKKHVVKPYKAGRDIFQMSAVTSPSEIGSLTIVRSMLTAEKELKRMSAEHQAKIEEENARHSIKIFSLGRGRDVLELREACEDVTASYISEAPGSGTVRTKVVSLLHNQWVTGVGLLIIGLVIGKLWGGGA